MPILYIVPIQSCNSRKASRNFFLLYASMLSRGVSRLSPGYRIGRFLLGADHKGNGKHVAHGASADHHESHGAGHDGHHHHTDLDRNRGADSSNVEGRAHLRPNGERTWAGSAGYEPFQGLHPFPVFGNDPHLVPQKLVRENGTTYVSGSSTGAEQLEAGFLTPQAGLLHYPFSRLRIWGNYGVLMKTEFLFMYIPTIVIIGMVIPVFTMSYAAEEPVFTTMTVKVIGRQWYWQYEIECPETEEDAA